LHSRGPWGLLGMLAKPGSWGCSGYACTAHRISRSRSRATRHLAAYLETFVHPCSSGTLAVSYRSSKQEAIRTADWPPAIGAPSKKPFGRQTGRQLSEHQARSHSAIGAPSKKPFGRQTDRQLSEHQARSR